MIAGISLAMPLFLFPAFFYDTPEPQKVTIPVHACP
jgi:hypothetical protein